MALFKHLPSRRHRFDSAPRPQCLTTLNLPAVEETLVRRPRYTPFANNNNVLQTTASCVCLAHAGRILHWSKVYLLAKNIRRHGFTGRLRLTNENSRTPLLAALIFGFVFASIASARPSLSRHKGCAWQLRRHPHSARCTNEDARWRTLTPHLTAPSLGQNFLSSYSPLPMTKASLAVSPVFKMVPPVTRHHSRRSRRYTSEGEW